MLYNIPHSNHYTAFQNLLQQKIQSDFNAILPSEAYFSYLLSRRIFDNQHRTKLFHHLFKLLVKLEISEYNPP